jgi:hypothetical protein
MKRGGISMKCFQCGKEIADDLKFCPYCGTKVAQNDSVKEKLNKDSNENYQKVVDEKKEQTESFPLNHYLDVLSQGKVVAIVGIITGCIFLRLIFIFNGSNNTSSGWQDQLAALSQFKSLPGYYYCALILSLVTCVLSILNVRRYKDLKTGVLALFSGLSSVFLLLNLKVISVLNSILSLSYSDITSGKFSVSMIEDIETLIKKPDQIESQFKLAIGSGILVLIVSIILLVLFLKASQKTYKELSLDSLKDFNSSSNKSESNSENKTSIKLSKKQKTIGAIVVALIVSLFGGYHIWNEYLNYTKIDMTKNMKVSFDGRSGNAEVEITENPIEYDKSDAQIADFINSITYDYSKNSELKNGDTVTITAVYNKEEANNLKLRVVNVSKKFKVSNLAYRFTDVKKIPTQVISDIKEDGLTTIKSENTDNDNYKCDISYYGTYFIKGETDDSLVVLYKIVNTSTYDSEKNTTYDYYVINDVDSHYSKNTSSDYNNYSSSTYSLDENSKEEDIISYLKNNYYFTGNKSVEKVE